MHNLSNIRARVPKGERAMAARAGFMDCRSTGAAHSYGTPKAATLLI